MAHQRGLPRTRGARATGFFLLAGLVLGGGAAAQPADHPRANAASPACKAGEIPSKLGLLGSMVCVRRFRDAGKACAGKKDCKGRCIATRMPKGVAPMVGARVAGICEAEKPSFGCFAEVDKGRLKTPMMCTD